MDKFWAVLEREYMERVRSKWFAFATLFGPILFAVLLFAPPWLAGRSRASADVSRIVIIDATGTNLGKRIAYALNGGIGGDTSRTTVHAVMANSLAAADSAARRAVLRGAARGYLVLDSATLRGERVRYVGDNATAGADMTFLEHAVRDQVFTLRLERAGVDPLVSNSLVQMHLDFEPERISSHGSATSARVSVFFAFGLALLLYTSIFMFGQNVLRGVIEEKQTRVAEVVVSSVSPRTLLAGKVLGVGAVGLTQMTIWVLASMLLVRARGSLLGQFGLAQMPSIIPDIPIRAAVLLLTFFLLGYIFYAALFAIVGSTVSNEHDAQQAQMPIVFLLIANVFFLPAVLTAPEDTLAYTLGWLPFSAPIVQPLRMSIIALQPLDLAVSISLLACSCYVAIWVAARVYRVGLLMYGKRPTLREVARWVGAGG